MEDVFFQIKKERVEQNIKWEEQNHNPYKWLTILMEEVGEASEAVLEADASSGAKKYSQYQKYRKELIQVAAVAIAAIESYDRNEGGREHDDNSQ